MISTDTDENIKIDTAENAGDTENANKAENEVKTRKIRKHPIAGHPFPAGILLLIHGFFFYGILSSFGRDDIEYGFLCVVSSVLLLLIHKLWFRPEFKGAVCFEFLKNRRVWIACGIFLIVDFLTAIHSYIEYGCTGPTVWAIVTALGAGTVEEVVFRALPASVMMRSDKNKNNILPVLIFTAVIFGSIHVLNVSHGQSLPMSVLQAVSAGASGILYGGLYLYSGSIIPSMIAHTLHDVFAGMVMGEEAIMAGSVNIPDTVENGIMIVVKILLAIWLLRGQKEKIRETWNRIWNS